MFDQLKALKFVKNTIKSFRGNPNLVTLMGQDAGAASVGMHIVSPRSIGKYDPTFKVPFFNSFHWMQFCSER